MVMDIVRENEERRAYYQCERAERCPYFQHYKTFGLLKLWGQGKLLRLCR